MTEETALSAQQIPDQLEHIGSRLRGLREAKGMSRETYAERSGFSARYVSMIETGHREVQKLSTIRQLAAGLGLVDLTLLTGDTRLDDRVHPATATIAGLVRRPATLAPPRGDEEPATVAELQGLVADQFRIWHSTPDPYSRLAVPLPALLRSVEQASARVSVSAPGEEGDRRAVAAVRALAWTIGRQWLRETNQNELAGLAAERALLSAQAADDPLLVAFAAWNLIGVHNANGYFEEAEEVATDAVAGIHALPESARTSRVMGMAGALMLYQAIARAHQDDEDAALRAWSGADAIARGLGGSFFDDWTCFGTENLGFYQVGIQVELGNGRKAADHAARIEVGRMSSRQRRGRYLIDVGRAHSERGEDDAALAAFVQAEGVAPEQLAYSWYARNELQILMRRWRVTDRGGLHGLASRLGLTA